MSNKHALQIRMDKHGNESPMVPLCEFDEKTGEFEYVDSVMRKKSDTRKVRKAQTDELKHRELGLRKHLARAGLEENFGKTGDSLTGTVSDKDLRVAKIQQEHTKIYIKRYRGNNHR